MDDSLEALRPEIEKAELAVWPTAQAPKKGPLEQRLGELETCFGVQPCGDPTNRAECLLEALRKRGVL